MACADRSLSPGIRAQARELLVVVCQFSDFSSQTPHLQSPRARPDDRLRSDSELQLALAGSDYHISSKDLP